MSEGAGHSPSQMQWQWHELWYKRRSSYRQPPSCRPFCSTQRMTQTGSRAGDRVEVAPGLTCSRRLPSVKKGCCGRNTTPWGPKQVSILMLPAQRHTHVKPAVPASNYPLPLPAVANKSPKRHICNTGQSNESQSKICDRDGWLHRTFTITR